MLTDKESFKTSIMKNKVFLIGLCELFEINYWI